MKNIIQDKWFAVSITIIVGVIIGFAIISPILNILIKRAKKHQLPYVAKLFFTLKRLSFLFGAILVLNFIEFYPADIILKNRFHISLKILNTIAVTILFSEFLVFVYEKYSQKKKNNKVSSIFHIIIRILVYFSGVLIISSILSYDLKAMLTAMGVGGLAIALALQDTLGNLFAGMQILMSKQLKPGDYIKIKDEVEGYVLDINWRNTTIRTLLENIIIVPNSIISTSVTTNYFTLQKNLFFHVFVGVHYDSDLDFVEKVTLEVAEEVLSHFPNLPKDFKPRVRFFEFADSSINFKVWLASDLYENQYTIKHYFIKELQKRYNKEGIIIPFPIRTIYMEK